MKLIIAFPLLLLWIIIACARGQRHKCFYGLGLENGRIQDAQIEASINTTDASGGRLNNPNSAWCFHYDKFIGQKAYFSVDLGLVHLISGFQSQGPPQALHPKEYLRYVGLEIEHSIDGVKWEECCNGAKMTFYADDRRDGANVVSTHSFKTVIAARYIRIAASTDVRWIGEAEKCFRFEILGCDPDQVIPEINFKAVPQPAGYLETSWSKPLLIIAQNEVVTLESSHYLVNVSHIEETLVLQEFNLSNNGLILPKPQWDVTYTFDLHCIHEDLHILDCGRFEVKAIIDKATRECLEQSSACPMEDRIQFMKPELLSAMSLRNGSIVITWTDSSIGWKTAKRRVKILDQNAKIILTTLSQENQNEIIVSDLKASDQSYELIFAPEGPTIPTFVQEFSTTLATLADTEVGLHRSFIASVNLRTSIIYSGQIRAFWDQAKASLQGKKNTIASTFADTYRVVLRQVGSEEILDQVSVKSMKFVHDFGGIEINTEYEVSLICIFGQREFPCGTSRIYSGEPIYVTEQEFSAKVYVQSRIPTSWQHMEYQCRSSNGHLVSFDSEDLEENLTYNTDLPDYWCGGNMCKNSPAPAHSMWSDGSPQITTNFASDSGLDGAHCCIKVEVINTNTSWWKGENCETLLKGICEFNIEEYLDTPSDVFGKGVSASALNISWSTDGLYWQPSDYSIEYCHKESLSKATLPIVGEKCHIIQVNGSRGPHYEVINGLEPFSEYEFKVIGKLQGFEKLTSTVANARTRPHIDVEWVVQNPGILMVSWLKKIADYKERDKVRLIYHVVGSNETLKVNGSAKQVKVPALKFGENYSVTLEDLSGLEQSVSFQFIAYPNCTLGQRQNMSCNYVSDQMINFKEALEHCNQLQMYSKKDQGIPLTNIHWNDLTGESSVWIGHQVSEGNTLPPNQYCQAWSIRRREYQSIPCDTELPVFCQADLIIETPAPSKTSLKVIPGPTHITLDWSAPPEGWITSYKIHVEPSKEANRSRREDRADNFTHSLLYVNQNGTEIKSEEIEFKFKNKPPINITDLLPETEYNFEITTSLNSKWATTLNLEDISTTANNSRPAEGIIGFTMTSAEYKAAEMSIFSIIMAMILFAIVLFLFSGTLSIHADNAVQVCFEVSLLLCHIFTLLGFLHGPLAWDSEDQSKCIVAMVALSYLSLCAFTFLFLESMCIAHHLMEAVSMKILEKIPMLVLAGFGIPFVYLAIVIPIVYDDLIPYQQKVCWLNLDAPEAAAIIAPNTILILLTFLILIVTIFGSSSNDELQQTDHYTNRTRSLQKNRYVLLAITSLMSLGWTFGITSAHFQESGLIITFLLVHFILAVVILALRAIWDDQVRVNLKRLANRDKEYEAARGRSAASGIMSASGSRKSTQVAPQPPPQDEASRITPVEQSTAESPTPTTKERPRTTISKPQYQRCKCSAAHHSCGWQHSSNALWKELENSPFNKRKNKEALRQFRRMCNEPYNPKVNPVNNSKINDVATYTSPFGEDQAARPQTRAKSRTKPRTPYVQSAPSLQITAKRPRVRKRPSTTQDSATTSNTNSMSTFLSLPNTPDTEDPMRIYRTNPHLVPGLSSETYI